MNSVKEQRLRYILLNNLLAVTLSSCVTFGPSVNNSLTPQEDAQSAIKELPPGFWQGSWTVRALNVADDPVALFDLNQNEGDSAITGTYIQYAYPYPMLDRQPGEVLPSQGDTKRIQLSWNPTNDQDEIWSFIGTPHATPKMSADEFVGTFCDRGRDTCFQAIMVPMPPRPLP